MSMGKNKKTVKDFENMNTNNHLSVLIKELRSYLRLSQASFAEPLGLSPTHIARFEKGVSVPSIETIDTICQVYSVDRRYFETSKENTSISVEDVVNLTNPEEGIAERIKIARGEIGWSQNELAKRSGVNQAIINRVEFGAKLTEKQAVKLAETLEIGVEWLMQGDEKKKKYPADQKMILWLWDHEDVRQEIWVRMHASEGKEQTEYAGQFSHIESSSIK